MLTDAPATTEIEAPADPRRWWALGVLSFSLVMIVMDNTILNVALPKLSQGLQATNSQLQWIVDAYTLVFAALLLTLGALGDRRGRRAALLTGLVVFAGGSVAATFADSATWLIVSRGVMGVGGALIMPSTLSIIANIFRNPKERAKAISIWSAASGVGIVAGPVLGGYLLEHYSWSSVFWINVPLAAAMFIATRALVPESKADDAPRTDWPGVILSAAGLFSLLYAIIEAPVHGWADPTTIGAFALAIGILGAFVAWELHTPEPMLDVRFFRNRRFSAANGAITLAMFGMFGSLFLVSQFLQFVQGYSALESGVRIIPFAAGMVLGAPLGNLGDKRIGTKGIVTLGLVITAAGLFSFTNLSVTSSYSTMAISMLIMSFGMGMVFGPATESVMGSLPPERAGVGSAINDTTRELGGALGVAVIGSAMSSLYSARVGAAIASAPMPDEAREITRGSLAGALAVAERVGGSAGSQLADFARNAFADGLHRGVTIGSIAVLAGAAAAFAFLPSRSRVNDAPIPEGDVSMSDTELDELLASAERDLAGV